MMFPTAFLLLSLVSAVTSSYVNDFDERFQYICPLGESIAYWESYHSNYYEDRRYKFICQKTPQLFNCHWHNNVNKLKGPLSFQCPKDAVIRGVSSYHENRHEDRLFTFLCCSLLGSPYLAHCVKTDFVNNWDQRLTFRVPIRHFLRGVSSTYSNYYHDRRWKFETCSIQ
ncbi:hemagglutinin/amebocyte aggregation factor-like [Haliotis rufescens]|uniref:hemagglutinin/amebocyte aggregation factor-like n=1 Tax=Haliotis rufescens TaxID=6454 RepID=UPI001EB00575|nr:hemagglutinin/amebocyte aggregation factor-like [Haliotis rufescens]